MQLSPTSSARKSTHAESLNIGSSPKKTEESKASGVAGPILKEKKPKRRRSFSAGDSGLKLDLSKIKPKLPTSPPPSTGRLSFSKIFSPREGRERDLSKSQTLRVRSPKEESKKIVPLLKGEREKEKETEIEQKPQLWDKESVEINLKKLMKDHSKKYWSFKSEDAHNLHKQIQTFLENWEVLSLGQILQYRDSINKTFLKSSIKKFYENPDNLPYKNIRIELETKLFSLFETKSFEFLNKLELAQREHPEDSAEQDLNELERQKIEEALVLSTEVDFINDFCNAKRREFLMRALALFKSKDAKDSGYQDFLKCIARELNQTALFMCKKISYRNGQLINGSNISKRFDSVSHSIVNLILNCSSFKDRKKMYCFFLDLALETKKRYDYYNTFIIAAGLCHLAIERTLRDQEPITHGLGYKPSGFLLEEYEEKRAEIFNITNPGLQYRNLREEQKSNKRVSTFICALSVVEKDFATLKERRLEEEEKKIAEKNIVKSNGFNKTLKHALELEHPECICTDFMLVGGLFDDAAAYEISTALRKQKFRKKSKDT